MIASEIPRSTDAAELQSVLTRCVDSHDGYLQTAEVVDSPNLAAAFREIAARREIIVEHGNLEANHAAVVAEVAAELKEALQTFEMMLER